MRGTRLRRSWQWAMVVCALCCPGLLQAAPDLPALLVLTGEIQPDAGVPVTMPGEGDRVLAFGLRDMQLVGYGPVGKGGGYTAILGRTTSFNGATVVLELQHGRKRYALLKPDGTPASFAFYGQTLPERVVMPLLVGPKTADLPESELANPQAQRLSLRADLPCTAELDVNEDGQCNEQDQEILSRYGGGVSRTVARP